MPLTLLIRQAGQVRLLAKDRDRMLQLAVEVPLGRCLIQPLPFGNELIDGPDLVGRQVRRGSQTIVEILLGRVASSVQDELPLPLGGVHPE